MADKIARLQESAALAEAPARTGNHACDRTGARTRFAAAANDRVPTVRTNALRGLAAAQ